MNNKTLKFKSDFGTFDLKFKISCYTNDLSTALIAYCYDEKLNIWDKFDIVSVNLTNNKCANDEIYIGNYENNELTALLENNKLIKSTNETVKREFGTFTKYKLNLDKLSEYMMD